MLINIIVSPRFEFESDCIRYRKAAIMARNKEPRNVVNKCHQLIVNNMKAATN